jgi:hypothetical protein
VTINKFFVAEALTHAKSNFEFKVRFSFRERMKVTEKGRLQPFGGRDAEQ